MAEKRVLLDLRHEEALVLFEWLARVDASGKMPIDDPAEQQVLWTLEAQLERQLVDPLAPNYQEALTRARQKVSEPK
jgi:hypothetical protein